MIFDGSLFSITLRWTNTSRHSLTVLMTVCQLKDIDGIKTARKMREGNCDCTIIFVSAYPEAALDSFVDCSDDGMLALGFGINYVRRFYFPCAVVCFKYQQIVKINRFHIIVQRTEKLMLVHRLSQKPKGIDLKGIQRRYSIIVILFYIFRQVNAS